MALEKVVYDRLRQRHDYIAHEQLRKWQPGEVVKILLQEVDANVTQTHILSMSNQPHIAGVTPKEGDFVTIGTEVGFDAKKIAKMWQALSNLALHVRLPRDKNDSLPDYGDHTKIRLKVLEVVDELERLSKGNMTFSGISVRGDVSFICTCGEKNKKRKDLIKDGQYVFCVNPKCDETWKVEIDGDDINFENVLIEVKCLNCEIINNIPWRIVAKMKYDEILRYPCRECKATNLAKWQLIQAVQSG